MALLAQLRHWEQRMQALPMYHPEALRPINNRRATAQAFTNHFAAFVKRITARLVS